MNKMFTKLLLPVQPLEQHLLQQTFQIWDIDQLGQKCTLYGQQLQLG